jgi:tRNA(Ile)-lysidine synthase
LYYVFVPKLPWLVLSYIQKHELLQPGNRVGLAVSGGADSVALLRLFLELRLDLGVVLSVVHVNHQLRGASSDADEQFVSALAAEHELDFHGATRNVASHAKQNGLSIETAAREVRYEYFAGLLAAGKLNRIATAHTLDDQAETVLMRLIRGTGLRGLGGIQPQLLINEKEPTSGTVVRPLLATRHSHLIAFLAALKQEWRQDASNNDLQHTRNRIRHVLMPLLEREFNPAMAERLGELSVVARSEEEFWQSQCSGWVEQIVRPVRPAQRFCFDLNLFRAQSLAVQRRLLRHWGRTVQPNPSLEFKHVEQLLALVNTESKIGKQLELPAGWRAVRRGDQLQLTPPPHRPGTHATPQDYQYRLRVPGRVALPEAGMSLEAISIPVSGCAESYNPDQLLDAGLLAKELVVRNWRPGDRFWPAHTKAPKKVKELLQEKHVQGHERKLWPLVVSEGEIVWLAGFACPVQFRARQGDPALLIRELSQARVDSAEEGAAKG